MASHSALRLFLPSWKNNGDIYWATLSLSVASNGFTIVPHLSCGAVHETTFDSDLVLHRRSGGVRSNLRMVVMET